MKDNKNVKSFGEFNENLNISDVSRSFTIHDLEKAFEAGADMKDCECEFDFHKRGYKPFNSFDEWFSENM